THAAATPAMPPPITTARVPDGARSAPPRFGNTTSSGRTRLICALIPEMHDDVFVFAGRERELRIVPAGRAEVGFGIARSAPTFLGNAERTALHARVAVFVVEDTHGERPRWNAVENDTHMLLVLNLRLAARERLVRRTG